MDRTDYIKAIAWQRNNEGCAPWLGELVPEIHHVNNNKNNNNCNNVSIDDLIHELQYELDIARQQIEDLRQANDRLCGKHNPFTLLEKNRKLMKIIKNQGEIIRHYRSTKGVNADANI